MHWLWFGSGILVEEKLLAGWPELLVGIGTEEVAEVAMDGRGIVPCHVDPCFEKFSRARDGLFGKGEDLETVSVEGEKVMFDQRISSQDVVVDWQVKDRADLVIAVKGDTVSVGCEGEEEVEDHLVVGEALQEAIPQEPVLDSGKASLDPAGSSGYKERSVNHGSPRDLWGWSSFRCD